MGLGPRMCVREYVTEIRVINQTELFRPFRLIISG